MSSIYPLNVTPAMDLSTVMPTMDSSKKSVMTLQSIECFMFRFSSPLVIVKFIVLFIVNSFDVSIILLQDYGMLCHFSEFSPVMHSSYFFYLFSLIILDTGVRA